ncbi:heparinase II/III domain-containing protein [Motilibacter deserti]|uniref:Heparinase II/III-like C-terminal domain-containing protein n=1 Tax=Motilibacter deserti TaxID=2714956 RepID=A0ABX0H208_9ACTN|nr:heparinase II/III family protein [Motilibacter deserti]NHC15468.1 hypothetical protein [Motilibacter deserti]
MRLLPRTRVAASLASLTVVAAGVLAVPGTVAAPAASAATTVGSSACLGYSGLDNPRLLNGDPKADLVGFVMRDGFKAPGIAAKVVGNGNGNVTWRQPSLGVSGTAWLHSLKWLGSLLSQDRDFTYPRKPYWRNYTAAEKNAQYARAVAVTKDWVADNPSWEKTDPRGSTRGIVSNAGHRLQFLLCLRQTVGAQGWLDSTIARHVAFLIGSSSDKLSNRRDADSRRYVYSNWKPAADWPRWQGPNNIGLDQSLGVISAGCELGRQDWLNVGLRRIGKHANKVYDAQGVDNEQAPGYSAYNFGLWTKTLDRLQTCGALSVGVGAQLQNAVSFIAAAHRPDGKLEQLGDTKAVASPIYGTVAEYAATQGASGPRPTERVGVYNSRTNGGYVFGRSGWGTDRPFAQESFYSLRFGAGRMYHGHDDHTSVTFYARGQQILTDGGHSGYTKGKYRDYIISPEAHNLVTVDGLKHERYAKTSLTKATLSDSGDSFVVVDKPYAGVTRQRSVLTTLTPQPDAMIVADTLTSSTKRHYNQLWHLGTPFVASPSGNGAVATSGDTTVHVLPIAVTGGAATATKIVRGATSPYQGWTSPSPGTRQAVSTVVVGATGGKVTMLTAVVPAAAGAAVSATATPNGTGGYAITLTIGDRTVNATLAADGALSR